MTLSGILVAVAILFVASAAHAQEAPPPADKASRLELAAFASCIVERQPGRARRAVVEDWDSGQLVYRDLLRESGCARAGLRLRFHAGSIKAAMADVLVRRDVGPADIGAVAAAPALAYTMPDPVRTVDGNGRPLSASSVERQQQAVASKLSWIAIAQFGECVARANPAAVPALAASAPASDPEMAALKAFSPQLPACLPKGVRLELDRSTLRGSVTLAYYRLAMAARAARLGAAQ